MTSASLAVATLASAVLIQAAAPVTNADLRLVATARPRVMVGEFLPVRTTWTARARIPLVIGAEWIEVDAGRGFQPHAEADFIESCPVSAPVSSAAGRSVVTEHLIGFEAREASAALSGLEHANPSIVLTSLAAAEPAIRDEGAALVARYGPRPLLRPYLRAIHDLVAVADARVDPRSVAKDN